MKKAIFALLAACALCCVPLIVPALAGVSVFGIGLLGRPLSLETLLCIAPLAILTGWAVFAAWKALVHRKAKVCAVYVADGDCGCK